VLPPPGVTLEIYSLLMSLRNDDGIVIFNFGKYQNQSVIDVIESNPSYYDWFMKAEFTIDSKKTLERVVEKHRQEVYETKIKEGNN
jgi:uncharacterized protein (DUF3820 family)